MKRQKMKADVRPYTRQFYKGNGFYFVLATVQILLLTASNLLVSWLIQQIIDLVAGESAVFTLPQLALITLAAIGMIGLAFACAYFSKPRFVSRAIGQYKNYVFEQLSKKSISAFSGENTSLYISALSNDATAIENNYLVNIFGIIDQTLKKRIEDMVIAACRQMLTDSNIQRIAEAIDAVCKSDYDSSGMKRIKTAIHEADVAIENLW